MDDPIRYPKMVVLYNPNLNILVSHPKVDVLYNPILDDFECVSICYPIVDVSYNSFLDGYVSSKSGCIWMIVNMLVSHPKVDVLYSPFL